MAVAVSRADQVAQAVLFPSAAAVDAASVVPAGHLDALAAAGLYGIAGPVALGGLDVDLVTFCRVIETLAGGCLATTFVWLQHHGAVRALAASANSQLRDTWLGPLVQGQCRAGIALGSARRGPPLLRASRTCDGYVLDGTAPWVTGWGLVDVVYTLARDAEDQLVAALLPARVSDTLSSTRLNLVAANASATVELRFTGHAVPADLVCSVSPHAEWLAGDAQGLRPNGSLSLGVAARCCRLIGDSPLDAELVAVRDRLDGADASAMPAARAAAPEFAYRAAGAAVVAAGSRGILVGEQPQRLVREAAFLLVFGSRPAIKEDLLSLLAQPAAR